MLCVLAIFSFVQHNQTLLFRVDKGGVINYIMSSATNIIRAECQIAGMNGKGWVSLSGFSKFSDTISKYEKHGPYNEINILIYINTADLLMTLDEIKKEHVATAENPDKFVLKIESGEHVFSVTVDHKASGTRVPIENIMPLLNEMLLRQMYPQLFNTPK